MLKWYYTKRFLKKMIKLFEETNVDYEITKGKHTILIFAKDKNKTEWKEFGLYWKNQTRQFIKNWKEFGFIFQYEIEHFIKEV